MKIKRNGIVLFTVLLVLLILFILATTLMSFMMGGYNVSKKLFYSQRAYYNALSGLEYVKAGAMSDTAKYPVKKDANNYDYQEEPCLSIPSGTIDSYCSITIKTFPIAAGDNRKLVICDGTVRNLSKRRIVCLYSDWAHWYEVPVSQK